MRSGFERFTQKASTVLVYLKRIGINKAHKNSSENSIVIHFMASLFTLPAIVFRWYIQYMFAFTHQPLSVDF